MNLFLMIALMINAHVEAGWGRKKMTLSELFYSTSNVLWKDADFFSEDNFIKGVAGVWMPIMKLQVDFGLSHPGEYCLLYRSERGKKKAALAISGKDCDIVTENYGEFQFAENLKFKWEKSSELNISTTKQIWRWEFVNVVKDFQLSLVPFKIDDLKRKEDGVCEKALIYILIDDGEKDRLQLQCSSSACGERGEPACIKGQYWDTMPQRYDCIDFAPTVYCRKEKIVSCDKGGHALCR